MARQNRSRTRLNGWVSKAGTDYLSNNPCPRLHLERYWHSLSTNVASQRDVRKVRSGDMRVAHLNIITAVLNVHLCSGISVKNALTT